MWLGFFLFLPSAFEGCLQEMRRKVVILEKVLWIFNKMQNEVCFQAVFLQWKQRHSSEIFLLRNDAITSLTEEKTVIQHLCVFLKEANSLFYRAVASGCYLVLIVEAHFWHQLKLNWNCGLNEGITFCPCRCIYLYGWHFNKKMSLQNFYFFLK